MNILVVQDTDWLIRGPHQQHHLIERLALKGHVVRVIDHKILWKTQDIKGLHSERQVFYDVSKIYPGAKITLIRPGIIKIPWLDYVSLFFAQRIEIARQIREFSPDVIVGLGILSSYLAARAAKRNVIPFVYYWIDVLHRLIPFKAFQPIGKILESNTLKQSDIVLAINKVLRNNLIGIGALPEKTFILRTGVNVEQFNPSVNGSRIRRKYGIKEDDFVILFMGWLYHFAGLKEVARQLARTNENRLKLLIVGEGDAYEELSDIRESCGLQKKVIMVGNKPYQEIPSFIAASDICLLPAYKTEKVIQDIVPIKMYEYMSMAKPVISTRLPGIVEEFGEGNGIIYVDRPEDAVEKAIETMKNSNLKELGARAKAFVERYNWQDIVDEFEKILEEVITKKRQTKQT
jgi:glycosyltransferase involved in cell wall biosynthesis